MSVRHCYAHLHASDPKVGSCQESVIVDALIRAFLMPMLLLLVQKVAVPGLGKAVHHAQEARCTRNNAQDRQSQTLAGARVAMAEMAMSVEAVVASTSWSE